jgi:hypothetical protein
MRLVSVYLCLVRIVEVMLPFGLNRRQDENKFVAAVCVCVCACVRAWKTAQPIYKI